MPTRRIIIAFARALAIGLVTNLAIAAFLGWWPSRSSFGAGAIISTDQGTWSTLRENRFGRVAITLKRVGSGPRSIADLRAAFVKCFPQGISSDPRAGFPASATEQAQLMLPSWSGWAAAGESWDERAVLTVGFPLKTLAGYQSGPSTAPTHSWGLLYWRAGTPRRFIPWIPLLWGTLANSVVFAVPWLLLLIALPALRRHLRSRRGHCPACNYDLHANFPAGCPECGWNRVSTPALVGAEHAT